VQRYCCTRCNKTFSESQPLNGLRTDHEKVVQIVKLLTEGVGVRATARLTDCQHKTVLAVLNAIGEKCATFLATNSANPSIINMNCNSQLNGVNLCLGDNWWWQGGPWVTLNMYDNAQVNCTNFWWGGKVNLYDNSIFTVTTNFIERTIGAITDSTKRMNIAGGTLVINGTTIATPAAYAADITNYISRGILLVYGKQYDTNEVIITIVPTTNWLANTYVCITETTQSPPI
jgi:hypothetical protein